MTCEENKAFLDGCVRFEWYGPASGALEVNGQSVSMFRGPTDWTNLVGDRPLIDKRSNNLADLLPSSRSLLQVIEGGLQNAVKKPDMKGPTLG